MYFIRATKVMFSHLVGLICGFSSHSPPLKPIYIKFITSLNEHILYVEGKDIFIPYGQYPTLLHCSSRLDIQLFLHPASPVPELSFLPAPYRGWYGVGRKESSGTGLASGESHSKNIEIYLPCMTYWDNQCFLEISWTPQAIFVASLSITSSAVLSAALADFASSGFYLYL